MVKGVNNGGLKSSDLLLLAMQKGRRKENFVQNLPSPRTSLQDELTVSYKTNSSHPGVRFYDELLTSKKEWSERVGLFHQAMDELRDSELNMDNLYKCGIKLFKESEKEPQFEVNKAACQQLQLDLQLLKESIQTRDSQQTPSNSIETKVAKSIDILAREKSCLNTRTCIIALVATGTLLKLGAILAATYLMRP